MRYEESDREVNIERERKTNDPECKTLFASLDYQISRSSI